MQSRSSPHSLAIRQLESESLVVVTRGAFAPLEIGLIAPCEADEFGFRV